MILKNILLLTIIFTFLNLSESLNHFIRGRHFIKSSEKIRLFKIQNNITDLYYDQELDHFKEADKRTWKQVLLVKTKN